MKFFQKIARLSSYVFILVVASALAFAECSFERTLKVNGAVNMQIETGSGSINVRPGNATEVRVCGHVRTSNWFESNQDAVQRINSNPPIQQSGNDIRIGHIDDPELRRGISISYDVVAPSSTQLHSSTGSGNQDVTGIAGPVDLSSGSGGVKLSDIGAGVRAHSGSGNIDVDDVKGSVFARAGSGSIRATGVSGGFDGETGSGHITLEQSSQGSVRAHTGSGGLELRNVKGSLQAQTGSGSIKAEGDPSGEWVVHTGSGSVQLRFPQDASFNLNAHTGSGSIDLNHPVTVQGSIGRKEVHGKVGGGGVPVQVETGSGSISID
jgi:DUF4097 and DUF4098 domain-containing protein YvlB